MTGTTPAVVSGPPAPPPATPRHGLRALVKSVADGLRRDADGIEADPHLNPHVRRADAEARRTAAERIDMAIAEDRATPGRPLREAFEEELRTMRRLAGAAAPSRAARVRAAVAECERLIREAMGSDS